MPDDTFFTEVASGEVRDADVPRDGLGRYLLPDMTTGEVKGRTRVTTVAGTMESGYGITIWRRRTVIRGMGLRPDLMARAGAADPSDPGYDKLMDSIEAAAFEAGGGSSGANLGSAQHHVFDRYFGKGESLDAIAEYFHADIKAVEAELIAKKIKIVPGYNERVVYCRIYDRGGRIDAIGELDDGTWVIIDWKTEKDPVEYPSGKTIQQAYYSNADGIMNYDTHEYEPMPPVRRDFSIVIWCRLGSGEAKALRVPVDLGWVGARIAEDNRAWHQQKINIHEYFPGTGLAPVVTSQPQVQPANGQAMTEQQPQIAQAAPPQPTNGAGNAAQIKEMISQQIQSGQQIGPEQVARMNTQAAAVVAQQMPPGVPPGTVAHGPASQPPQYPGYEGAPAQQPAAEAPPQGVPPGPQPPAPKGSGKNTPPAEYIQDLIARTGAGIDPEVFYTEMVEELATLSKKEQLQPMLRLISPGIDEASLRKHREPLASMIVECVKAQHAMRNRDGAQPQPALQDPQPQQNNAPAPWGQQPGIVDMTYDGVMKAISEAPGQDRLWAIYQQWTNTYGPESWVGHILDAANAKLATLQQLTPTH